MQPDNYDLERQHCLLLKAEIITCMTQEVKLKIIAMGYTPSEIATAYILQKYNYDQQDYCIVDTHSILLDNDPSIPSFKRIKFDESGRQIVDVEF
jgi:hypothetical protein